MLVYAAYMHSNTCKASSVLVNADIASGSPHSRNHSFVWDVHPSDVRKFAISTNPWPTERDNQRQTWCSYQPGSVIASTTL
eukprot:748037-Hanusia_phi.AAC.2